MANTMTAVTHAIAARGLLALRELVAFPRLVNANYSNDARKKGTTVDVSVPHARTASAVTPSSTPIAAQDSTPTEVQITLDQWRKANYHMSDKEMAESAEIENFLPGQASEAIKAVADEMNTYLAGIYETIYGYAGTAGTTPFATTAAAATSARKVLFQQEAPPGDRRLLLDFDAEENALLLSTFADAEKIGSNGVKIDGVLGRKYGFDCFAGSYVQTHTAGTGASMQTAAAGSVGDTTIATDTGTGTLTVGDVVSFAGHSQTYTIDTADADVSTGSISFTPALTAAVADNEAITLRATHVVNLAFHRDAWGFAQRPVADQSQDGNQAQITDPVTGISLRLEKVRQHKQTVWEFDVLYGAQLIRPELACRVAG